MLGQAVEHLVTGAMRQFWPRTQRARPTVGSLAELWANPPAGLPTGRQLKILTRPRPRPLSRRLATRLSKRRKWTSVRPSEVWTSRPQVRPLVGRPVEPPSTGLEGLRSRRRARWQSRRPTRLPTGRQVGRQARRLAGRAAVLPIKAPLVAGTALPTGTRARMPLLGKGLLPTRPQRREP